MTGIEVVKALRLYISKLNVDYAQKCKILEPDYVFVTAFCTLGFKKHLEQYKIQGVYEKPLQLA